MSKFYNHPESHYTFDFSCFRVKLSVDNGKGKSLSKFDIASQISHHISYYKGLYLDEVCNYRECKDFLKQLLFDGDYINVSIYV